MPDWEESLEGFQRCLESLFRSTPPTALFINEAPFYVAALHFCSSRGLRVPEDVSLVCTDPSPAFDWCWPTVAHIRWDTRPVVRRIVRWAAHVSQGRKDLRQTLTKAEFVPGVAARRRVSADEDGWPMLGASRIPSSRHPRWANAFRPSLEESG